MCSDLSGCMFLYLSTISAFWLRFVWMKAMKTSEKASRSTRASQVLRRCPRGLPGARGGAVREREL